MEIPCSIACRPVEWADFGNSLFNCVPPSRVGGFWSFTQTVFKTNKFLTSDQKERGATFSPPKIKKSKLNIVENPSDKRLKTTPVIRQQTLKWVKRHKATNIICDIDHNVTSVMRQQKVCRFMRLGAKYIWSLLLMGFIAVSKLYF